MPSIAMDLRIDALSPSYTIEKRMEPMQSSGPIRFNELLPLAT